MLKLLNYKSLLIKVIFSLIITLTIAQQKCWAPVSVSTIDPESLRSILGRSNTSACFVEVGENIEIVIFRGITGSFKLNTSTLPEDLKKTIKSCPDLPKEQSSILATVLCGNKRIDDDLVNEECDPPGSQCRTSKGRAGKCNRDCKCE